MLSLSANEKTIRVKVACVNFHVFPPETQKPKALTSGLNLFGRRLKLWRRYQIYTKYMPISSFLQYLADNLLPFVVNVIAKHDVATGSLVSYTVWSLRRNAPRNFETSLFC